MSVIDGDRRKPDDILFLAYANEPYEKYVLLYIFSILYHVKNSHVEVILEDSREFIRKNSSAIDFLSVTYGKNRVLIRSVDQKYGQGKILANSVRFLSVPDIRAKYVYIGDIDIIVLEKNIIRTHVKFMNKMGLRYSNSVRLTDNSRMSGLHFSEFDAYYPLPDVSDVNLKRTNDEVLLRLMCERKGYPIQDKVWFRPVHGIHISPNRKALPSVNDKGREIPGWGINSHIFAFEKFIHSPEFCMMSKYFNKDILSNIIEIIGLIRNMSVFTLIKEGKFRELFDVIRYKFGRFKRRCVDGQGREIA